MRVLKRVFCVFLSMALVFSMCGINVLAASVPRLNKTSMIMLTGSSTTLNVISAGSAVKWSSSDTSVCTVSKNGKVTAKKPGKARIYAKTGSKKLYCNINVVKSYISAASDKTVNKGERMTFYLKSYRVNAADVYSTDSSVVKAVSSSVSDGRIKVVIDAVSVGTAYIKVSDRNNKNASAAVKVTVNAPIVENDTVNFQVYYVTNSDGTITIYISPSDSGSDTGTSVSDSSARSGGGYAEEVLDIVNRERAAVGASPLVLDDTLCRAAQARAKEIGKSFSHTRPDGRECFSILDEYGVRYYACGENIAAGASTSEGVMKMWMNSSGHRSNILNTSYGKLGVGYDSSTNSWVQIFTN